MQNSPVAPPASSSETATSLVPLLSALLRRRTRISWLDWLPIIAADAESPGTWCESFANIGPDDQCHLLDVLLQPGSGSFADILLISLAANAEHIADEQVRQNLLHDVGSAWERIGQNLQASTLHRDALVADKTALRKRCGQSLDLTTEIARTEVEIAALRAQEFEVDEEFTRLHGLERERREWQRCRAVLSLFDVEQAQEQVAQLRAEMEQSQQRREELQHSIQSLDSQLTTIRPGVLELEAQYTSLTKELSSLEQQRTVAAETVAQAEASLAEVRATLVSAQTRKNELETTLRSVKAEADGLAQQGKQWSTQCEHERARLEDLKRHADAAKRHDITAKIAEVFQLLPNDRPDDQFTT